MRIIKAAQIHHLTTMNACTKFKGNPSKYAALEILMVDIKMNGRKSDPLWKLGAGENWIGKQGVKTTSLAKAKKKMGYMQENTEDIKTQSIRSIYTDLGTRQQDIYTVTRQHFPKKKKGLIPKK